MQLWLANEEHTKEIIKIFEDKIIKPEDTIITDYGYNYKREAEVPANRGGTLSADAIITVTNRWLVRRERYNSYYSSEKFFANIETSEVTKILIHISPTMDSVSSAIRKLKRCRDALRYYQNYGNNYPHMLILTMDSSTKFDNFLSGQNIRVHRVKW